MPDMLVKLYDLPEKQTLVQQLAQQGIMIKRGMSGDMHRAVAFVEEHFNASWRNSCQNAFARLPSGIFLAVRDKQIIGFACYDVVVRNFFGPTGVTDACRGLGVGKALLLECLHAMRSDGYAYAIIGWAEDAQTFYQRTVGATVIPNSFPGAYRNMVALD
ncbi:GNAT family N-acetyltransferase [Paenibacillus daejeonensis]|uniref:GNAT family N-acetyltransferase n=1 Tax=Paenibacillus daejeonensis TaxID=135193 RepID=UPI00037E29EA|nr:GNAT family N-acetyltransferase [Paenibacillus daejeonensis]